MIDSRNLGHWLLGAALYLPIAGCGGTLPASPSRESGQSALMGETFAGQNRCNPKNHNRPFVVEWDGTDMSSFESFAASDVVIVRYEGCELTVLDRCRNDSVRGALGAYRPIDWTSGQLETVDIANEGDLHTKLPLGVASLGGRVHAGEKFHMEYYVAGTRKATRDAVYRADVGKLPGCKGATHFVYGYNVGAFALGSVRDLNAQAGGSIYGFGAGGATKSSRQVDKKGGALSVCGGNSATEVAGCKVPVRLVLREIHDGDNPDRTAQASPESDAALNAAGKVAQKVEMDEQARAHFSTAQEKMNSSDGKGCLAELDAHDKLNPKHKSTEPKSGIAIVRGQCLMSAGQCDAGKQLARKALEASLPQATPEQLDQAADGLAARHCQGSNVSDRDQYLKALNDLDQGSSVKRDRALCQRAYDTVLRLRSVVKPRDDGDSRIVDAQRLITALAPRCFARGGDCSTAFKVFVQEFPKDGTEKLTPEQLNQHRRNTFDSSVPDCRGKLKD